MKMIIELESLDDLINLIGLARCVEPKEPKKQEAPKPIVKEPTFAERANKIWLDMEEARRRETQRMLDEKNRFLDCPIEVLGLKPAAESALINRGISEVGDLTVYSILELKKLPNVGKVSIRTIKEALKKYNIELEER